MQQEIKVAVIRKPDGTFWYYLPALNLEGEMKDYKTISDQGMRKIYDSLHGKQTVSLGSEIDLVRQTKFWLRVNGLTIDNYIQNLRVVLNTDFI